MTLADAATVSSRKKLFSWLVLLASLYAMLLAVGIVGSGFKWISGGKEGAEQLFSFAVNPFLSLLVGILATALVQSSSTVTSVIVGLVAGGMPVEAAIPMIMGANIGTTITNTLVSLGHATKKDEFRQAFAAATVHDFFNLLAVMIFLPLEMMFGLLEHLSGALAPYLAASPSATMHDYNFMGMITKPAIHLVKDGLGFLPAKVAAGTMIFLGVILIFASITLMGKVLRTLMVGRAKQLLHAAIGRGPISGISSGVVMTVLVQSSSTTTSMAVPLVGTGVFTVRDIYPFTLGANIGTCITAILAATAISGAPGVLAMQIALVHLLYNVLGVILVYGIPFLREVPLNCANKLAAVASKRHSLAALYVLSVFFIIPGICVFIVAALD